MCSLLDSSQPARYEMQHFVAFLRSCVTSRSPRYGASSLVMNVVGEGSVLGVNTAAEVPHSLSLFWVLERQQATRSRWRGHSSAGTAPPRFQSRWKMTNCDLEPVIITENEHCVCCSTAFRLRQVDYRLPFYFCCSFVFVVNVCSQCP